MRRTYRLPVELALIAATLFVWQLLRIPLQGSVGESLAHAQDWLAAERALHIHVEPELIRAVQTHGHALHSLAALAYGNLHVAVVVGLLAAACVRDPIRYPALRTAFMVMHVPACRG